MNVTSKSPRPIAPNNIMKSKTGFVKGMANDRMNIKPRTDHNDNEVMVNKRFNRVSVFMQTPLLPYSASTYYTNSASIRFQKETGRT